MEKEKDLSIESRFDGRWQSLLVSLFPDSWRVFFARSLAVLATALMTGVAILQLLEWYGLMVLAIAACALALIIGGSLLWAALVELRRMRKLLIHKMDVLNELWVEVDNIHMNSTEAMEETRRLKKDMLSSPAFDHLNRALRNIERVSSQAADLAAAEGPSHKTSLDYEGLVIPLSEQKTGSSNAQ